MNRWLGVPVVAIALFGCKQDLCDPVTNIKVDDKNNYSYEATFEAEVVEIQAQTDGTICWTGLTTDVRGRAVTPERVEKVTMSRFFLTEDEVAAKIVANDLTQDDSADYFETNGALDGSGCVDLSELEILQNPLIPDQHLKEDADSTWVATLWETSPYGREDIIQSAFVRPIAASSNNAIDLVDSSSELTFDTDMSSLDTVCVEAEDGKQTLDWSKLELDTLGKEWDVRRADTLLIGKVDGAVKDAEAQFIQLYETADEIYTMTVYGQTFAKLVDDGTTDQVNQDGEPIWPVTLDGDQFEGFTEDGTWLMGIECSTCTSPAPLFLTVLDVVPPSKK